MKYEVAIIGAGPAGLTAGIFTTGAGVKTICFEKLAVGGQAALSYEIANYPAFEKISGFELSEKFYNHALSSGVEFCFDSVVSLKKKRSAFEIVAGEKIYLANKVIIATGSKPRELNLPNEKEFIGKGVSYCASCDGRFFKNKVVAVVGGGDSAFEYVDYLANIAKKVYLINRTESFKAGEHKLNKAKKFKNVEILTSSKVIKLIGKERLSQIEIQSKKETKLVKCDGLFVAVGHIPDLDFLAFDVEKDKNGFVVVDANQKTSVKNLYACGDIVSKDFKQVITACADGARAGNSCIGE